MRLSDWFEHRTGYRRLVHDALYEHIPGGAKWRYIWGSMLAFVFTVQVVTGILLMTVYSPSATTAWSSVWYIQTQMGLGWLIRGMHHFGSQAMVILLPLHILQVVFAKAYRAPREVNWWIGLGLLGVVFGLSLTGYLLPWDQKGYWATKVATNIMGLTPVIGPYLQKLVIGGNEYGHLTLTRFYTLHVMVLPATLVLLMVGHIALFRRHGVTFNPKDASQPEGTFWPEQVLKDAVGCLVVLCLIAGAAWYMRLTGDHLLDAPADPAAANYPARPEWYFLFLFQMLKYFEGDLEVVGAIGVPTAILVVFFLIPLLDKIMWRWLAHGITVTFVLALFGGAGFLTYQAIQADRDPADSVIAAIHEKQQKLTPGQELTHDEQALLRARQFNEQRRQATVIAERAIALAGEKGIPPSGPLDLLASDPMIRGPQLFATHCVACHRINGTDGMGGIPLQPATSSDLGGFASQAWIRGLIETPMHHNYFGLMKRPDGEPAHTRMAKWIEDALAENEAPDDRIALMAHFDAVAAYLCDESRQPGRLEKIPVEKLAATQPASSPASAPTLLADAKAGENEGLIRKGRVYFMNTCNECHSYGGERSGSTRAPEMRGYGSVDWIEKFIENPADEAFYRSTGKERAQMPPFKDKLTQQERRLIAQWLHTTQKGPHGGHAKSAK